MIENVILLLIANTIVPFFPFQPLILLPTPFLLFQIRQPSIYQNMNLTRLFSQSDLKRSFRQSLKTHHPDHGGKQQIFQQIQGLKKIMQLQINYHDLYNVTDIDLSTNSNLNISNIVEIKQLSFYLQLGIFYFIAILYILGFTIQDEVRSSRKYLLLLSLFFLGYQYFINKNPKMVTMLDYVNDKIPLFEQKEIMKKIFIILLSILRTHYLNKKTIIKSLNQSLEKTHTMSQYKDILTKLCQEYQIQAIEKQKSDLSLWTTIKKYISQIFSYLFIGIAIYNLVVRV